MRNQPVLFASLVLFAACTVNPWREQQPPWTAATVVGAELVGQVERVERSLLLNAVARLETRRIETMPVIMDTIGTVLLTVGIALTAVVIVVASVF